MPFGPEPLGLVYFAGVKLAGYSAAGIAIRKRVKAVTPHALKFGAARTAIGLGVGVLVATSLARLGLEISELAVYGLLLPIRMAEWSLAIWLFFGRGGSISRSRILWYAFLGSLWSYALDVPALVSMFVLPGGAWIC